MTQTIQNAVFMLITFFPTVLYCLALWRFGDRETPTTPRGLVVRIRTIKYLTFFCFAVCVVLVAVVLLGFAE